MALAIGLLTREHLRARVSTSISRYLSARTRAGNYRTFTAHSESESSVGHSKKDQYVNRASGLGAVNIPVSDDVTDYSQFHEPVGALSTALPSTTTDWHRYKLSDTQVRMDLVRDTQVLS
jgi:hypothetical protein